MRQTQKAEAWLPAQFKGSLPANGWSPVIATSLSCYLQPLESVYLATVHTLVKYTHRHRQTDRQTDRHTHTHTHTHTLMHAHKCNFVRLEKHLWLSDKIELFLKFYRKHRIYQDQSLRFNDASVLTN